MIANSIKSATLPHRRFLPEFRESRWRRFRAIPSGLIGMFLMIGAVESFLTGRGPVFQDPVCFSWCFSAAGARQQAVKADILCLGDSLAKHGLIPDVIEVATGRPTYNLAVAAGPVTVTEILFQRAVDGGARPSAIVFNMNPGILAGGPRYRLREWQEILTLREAIAMFRAARGGSFFAELAIGASLASFRARHEVRANVLEALRGERSRLLALNAICKRNWTVNRGGNLATPSRTYHGEVSEAQHEEHLSGRFSAHRVNVSAAVRLLANASSRRIRIYLVIPPMTSALIERQQTTGAAAKYESWVQSLQSKYPTLTVLDARESHYPATVFVDPIHLDARGASTLSADVAHVLKEDLSDRATTLPGRRWIHLPRYRDVELPADLEDVEHSRERLGIVLKP